MPSSTPKQAKVMSAIAHGWKPKGKAAGIPVSVAKEFHAADAGKKWGGKHRNTAGSKVAEHWKSVYHHGHAAGGGTGENEPEYSQGMLKPQGNPFDLSVFEEGLDPGDTWKGQQDKAKNEPNPFQLGGDIVGMHDRPGMLAEQNMFQGPIKSKVPGRTDKLRLDVKPGSYIMPADIVSGIGEGNTDAGHAMVKALFTPHGLGGSGGKMGGRGGGKGFKMPNAMKSQMPHGRGMGMTGLGGHRFAQPGMGMRPPRMGQGIMAYGGQAHGGTPQEGQEGVPIVAAGGEHVISPEEIIWKFGSLNRGHNMLDHIVKHLRKKHIKQQAGLPPPKK